MSEEEDNNNEEDYGDDYDDYDYVYHDSQEAEVYEDTFNTNGFDDEADGDNHDRKEKKTRITQGDIVVPDGSYIIKEYSEISPRMELLISNVSSLLNLDPDVTEILLQRFKWNKEKLQDAFFSDSDKVFLDFGLSGYDSDIIQTRIRNFKDFSSSSKNQIQLQLQLQQQLPLKNNCHTIVEMEKSDELKECSICFSKFEDFEGFALGCNHWFCLTCYTQYLISDISSGPACIQVKCPEYKCDQAMTRAVVESILLSSSTPNAESAERYAMYMTRNYIDTSKSMKYCPAPNCTKVAIGSGITRVRCVCSNLFCFRCGEEAHDPCNCLQMSTWAAKCSDESETANWILANTKKCTKCSTRIEKNQGCNHMTCKLCKHEFCWICSGDWSDHGQNTGGFYKCNRYEGDKIDQSSTAIQKAKAELDRYLHFYQRYHGHDHALKFASTQREGAERKMLEQQETHKSSWIDVQFLKQAVEQVIESRRLLKYTYVYAFFLDEDAPEKGLFEHHQEMLEKNTDRLQECTEGSLCKIDKTQVINMTRVTENFLKSLLESIALEPDIDYAAIKAAAEEEDVISAAAASKSAASSPRGKSAVEKKSSSKSALRSFFRK